MSISKQVLKEQFRFNEITGGFLFRRINSKKDSEDYLAVFKNELICNGKVIVNLDFVKTEELKLIISRVINSEAKKNAKAV